MGAKSTGFILWLLLGLTAACYYAIGYLVPRSSFFTFILLAGAAFLLYFAISSKVFTTRYFSTLLWSCFLFRLIFLFAIPELSDDYARFVWDGMLTDQGINVYGYTPVEIGSLNGQSLSPVMAELRKSMNSTDYYSVYPPVLQGFFYLSVKLGGDSLVADLAWYRVLSLLAEGGTIYVILKLLRQFDQPGSRVFLYALNPLVIIEFAGNLHGEVFMLLGLSLAAWWLVREQLLWSAIALGLAVSTKLMPLILLPALISYLGVKRGLVYSLLTLLTVAVSFLPFPDPVIFSNITSSVGLYFDRFEFNASIYYLLLWIGYDVTGVNIIFVLGKLMSVCCLLAICWYNFRTMIVARQDLMKRFLFTVVIYYLFSLVVHPWYISVLLFLSLFTSYRFAYAWSALVLLTYSAYRQVPYEEIIWLTALEYVGVGVYFFWEYRSVQKERSEVITKGWFG